MKYRFWMFGLLAASPTASHAAMVQMDDAALSEVNGEAISFGFNLKPQVNLAFSNSPSAVTLSSYVGIDPSVEFHWHSNRLQNRSISYDIAVPIGRSRSLTFHKG